MDLVSIEQIEPVGVHVIANTPGSQQEDLAPCHGEELVPERVIHEQEVRSGERGATDQHDIPRNLEFCRGPQDQAIGRAHRNAPAHDEHTGKEREIEIGIVCALRPVEEDDPRSLRQQAVPLRLGHCAGVDRAEVGVDLHLQAVGIERERPHELGQDGGLISDMHRRSDTDSHTAGEGDLGQVAEVTDAAGDVIDGQGSIGDRNPGG